MAEIVLDVAHVVVSYGGLRAVDNVSLELRAGRITGIVGHNGAGKTTLIDAICGATPIRSGRIVLSGNDLTRRAPHARARAGLARTFQRLQLFNSMTVAQNLIVAAEQTRLETPIAVEMLEFVGMGWAADLPAAALPIGPARRVEIARALCGGAKVLLLDEPASGLDPQELAIMEEIVRRAARERGIAVALIEHDVSFVAGLCDDAMLMDGGRVVSTGAPAEVLSQAEGAKAL